MENNNVNVENTNANESPKIYTQADVDNITNKVRATMEKDFEKKLNALTNENNKIKLEAQFVQNGGKKEAFEDFYASTMGYDFKKENCFDEIKKNKPYFFNNSGIPNTMNINLQNERNSLSKDLGSKELIPNTFYYKK